MWERCLSFVSVWERRGSDGMDRMDVVDRLGNAEVWIIGLVGRIPTGTTWRPALPISLVLIFLFVLSLRGKAEFQGWPAIPNSPETVGTNGIGGLGRSFAGSQFFEIRDN